MSQDEEFSRRNSVKRAGKRFTVDMRKELDSLIADCYEEDSEECSDITSATPESTPPTNDEPPVDAGSIPSSPANTHPAPIGDQQDIPQPVQQEEAQPSQEETQVTTEVSTKGPKPTRPPRKLVYSRSQNKIDSPYSAADGNGRTSNPTPVDPNYGNTTQENQVKSEEETQSVEAPVPKDPPTKEPEPIKKAKTMPDLRAEIPGDKKQTTTTTTTATTTTSTAPAGSSDKGRKSLFFDNVATKVARAVIITTNTVNGPQGPYTVYVMEAYSESGQVIQNVSKRFKAFSELVDKLKDRAPEVVGMLPHRVILGNMAAKLVSHRKVQLQALLDYILNHKELSRSVDVLAFFRSPTLLKQLASKPEMEGYLNRALYGALGTKYIQMWASLKSPCLYFWQSESETAELKSAVVLRWLTVEIADEATFTIELRPWQYLLFPSDTQSRPTSIRASNKDEMISWVRALHISKAAVNDILMLKKTMLQEEDATSEMDLGDDDEDILTPRQTIDSQPPKIPPLSLSGTTPLKSSDSSSTQTSSPRQESHSSSGTSPSSSPSSSPRSSPVSPRADAIHRSRNQTQPPTSQAPPKLTGRSQTESKLQARKPSDSTTSSPSSSPSSSPTLAASSPSAIRHSTPVAKLKDFAEKTESQPLSRFEARMALFKEPPKYPPPSPGKMAAKKPENNPLLLTSHLPTPDTDENILLSSTKQQYIRGASANKLFEKVIDHTFTGTEYLDLVSAFLIGYRTFASPMELLDRLIQAFHASSLRKSDSGSTTRLCICNFISKWVDFHLHDFSADTNLVNKLITFLDSNLQAHVPHNERTAVEKVKTTIKKKTRDVAVISDENHPPSILPPLFSSICTGLNIPFLVMDFDKTEIARHLCTLEFDAFSKILPPECLGQSWNKKNKESKAPNITAIIKRFNEVSCWVSSMLVTTEELKARTAVLARFIEIAEECRQFNNFNSVVAIVSGLESSSVHRLRKTWAGLPPQVMETFDQLKSLMTTEKNYLTYRNVVKLANPPCIPYLGVFLTDLVFIDEAPDVLQPSGLINFDKWYKVAWVVREIRKFQVTHYPFRTSPEVLRALSYLPALPENEIYSLSLKCEERAKS